MPTVFIATLPYLLKGAVITLWLSAVCIGTGTVLGVALGIASAVGPAVLRWMIIGYVFVFRGTPVLVQMFLAYFAAPKLGLVVSPYLAVGCALALYTAAFVTEITRGAIQSVPRSQVDAALSLGLVRRSVLRHVVFPQAAKLSLPPLLNNSVIMVKATSYASVVGVWELTYAAREVVERTLAAFQVFFGVMIIYFVICYPLSLLSRALERRFEFAS